MDPDVKSFCASMKDEMTAWKARIYNLIQKAEEISPSPNQKVKASIDDMKAMIDRTEKTIVRLEKDCPGNRDSEKTQIEQAMCDMQAVWSEAAAMSPDDLE